MTNKPDEKLRADKYIQTENTVKGYIRRERVQMGLLCCLRLIVANKQQQNIHQKNMARLSRDIIIFNGFNIKEHKTSMANASFSEYSK